MKPTLGATVNYRPNEATSGARLLAARVIRTRESSFPPPPSPGSCHLNDDVVDLLVHGLDEDFRVYNATRGSNRGQWDWWQHAQPVVINNYGEVDMAKINATIAAAIDPDQLPKTME